MVLNYRGTPSEATSRIGEYHFRVHEFCLQQWEVIDPYQSQPNNFRWLGLKSEIYPNFQCGKSKKVGSRNTLTIRTDSNEIYWSRNVQAPAYPINTKLHL